MKTTLSTYELIKNGFFVKKQLNVPVFYDNLQINTKLKLDLLVNDLIVVELKTVDNIVKSMKPLANVYFSMLED
ncbi:GxxExxY protein [Pedobacter anseongensis]|uniref:GxxExxY protein n=1 Tax=Pedobacter anseongensis TaxID=3133439 RepID=UPI003D75E51C